jgi:hypothetical protein
MPKTEKDLNRAVRDFCLSLKRLIRTTPEARTVLNFAIEIFRKRLLSSPVTFADTWLRFKGGLADVQRPEATEVASARRATEEDIDDDQERESRGHHAAKVVGAWIHRYADVLAIEIAEIDDCLAVLGLTTLPVTQVTPSSDSRFQRMSDLIDQRLRNAEEWIDDERLIVFTEYKTTLEYIVHRLTINFGESDGRIAFLYGGMPDADHKAVLAAFNDPQSPVRVLVATDVASEGLNLQYTARLLLHYDIPWNPSRLEQRNGRIDRHGQARDVTVYHFASDDDADLRFVSRVIAKVNDIREDLGSVGELFDAAFQRRMVELQEDHDVLAQLDHQVSMRRNAARDAEVHSEERGTVEQQRFRQLLADLDLTPATLEHTLQVAMGLGSGRQVLEGPDPRGRMRLLTPVPPRWKEVIEDGLRLPGERGTVGALPWLVFDNQFFVENVHGRPVFRPSPDTVLLHLGHPVLRHALASFARLRFPGGQADAIAPSRWTVSEGEVPSGAGALVLLTIEEMAVNDLRETLHHWVRTLAIPVAAGELGGVLPYAGPHHGRPASALAQHRVDEARRLWDAVDMELGSFIKRYRQDLTESIRTHLVQVGKISFQHEKEAFERRINEVAALQRDQSLDKLRREIEERRSASLQLDLLEDANERAERELRDLQDELTRRTGQFGDLLERLKSEKERILERVVPRRFSLRGDAQVFPLTVEIRFPGPSA